MPAPEQSSTLPPPSAVVLLVTSDEGLAGRVRSMCAPDRNIAVHACHSVGDAEVEALEIHPTVVLLDLEIGGRTPALDLLRRFRRRPETSALPVIVLGESKDAQLRGAVFDAGAADYVEKLPDSIELRARIKQHSEAFNARAERNDAVSAIGRLQRQLRDAIRDAEDARRTGGGASAADATELRARIDSLTRLGVELSRIHDFHLLMERILSEARAVARADAGTIYIREGESLRFAFSQNDTLEQPGRHSSTRFSSLVVPVSARSIAGWSAMSGEIVNVVDAYLIDPSAPYAFDRSYDAVTGYRTRSVIAVPLRNAADVVLGVLQLLNAPGTPDGAPGRFSREDERLVKHFASMATVVIERAQLTESVILRMIRMAEVHDPSETTPHVERVSGYAAILFEEWARRRGLEGANLERQRDRLRIAAKLHDVGKVGVSDRVLKKPGLLDEHERGEIERHVIIGGDLFDDMPTDYDEAAREVALMHHERWDGAGYPHRLSGESIPQVARIMSIADSFDAMRSERPYRRALSDQEAMQEIREGAGRQFDPRLAKTFLQLLERQPALAA